MKRLESAEETLVIGYIDLAMRDLDLELDEELRPVVRVSLECTLLTHPDGKRHVRDLRTRGADEALLDALRVPLGLAFDRPTAVAELPDPPPGPADAAGALIDLVACELLQFLSFAGRYDDCDAEPLAMVGKLRRTARGRQVLERVYEALRDAEEIAAGPRRGPAN